jgi:6-pyruvoyltetrahydropterin/6-carboxytetrahydropterin synthase
MLVDYGEMKKAIDPVVEEYLDHHFLNETLKMTAPTSESIAEWVFNTLRQSLPSLVAVKIKETCTASATYWGIEARDGKDIFDQ